MAEEEKKPEETEAKKEEAKEELPSEADIEEKAELEVDKDVIAEVPEGEEEIVKKAPTISFDVAGWTPKTGIGKKVKTGEIKNIDQVLDPGHKILEAQIVDILLPEIESDLLLIGQSKGKFGGGQRRIFKQTQKKTAEGNKPRFETMAVVGNRNGYVGVGVGKSRETVPAREKAVRNAKLSIFKISRGCGSWLCGCKEPHTIPFKVHGKCGSVNIWLFPAPKGKGLIVEPECAKILKMAGIQDVFAKTIGHTASKVNFMKACVDALHKLSKTKVNPKDRERIGIVDGRVKRE
jgi:small subunit ribosomal protein S5